MAVMHCRVLKPQFKIIFSVCPEKLVRLQSWDNFMEKVVRKWNKFDITWAEKFDWKTWVRYRSFLAHIRLVHSGNVRRGDFTIYGYLFELPYSFSFPRADSHLCTRRTMFLWKWGKFLNNLFPRCLFHIWPYISRCGLYFPAILAILVSRVMLKGWVRWFILKFVVSICH